MKILEKINEYLDVDLDVIALQEKTIVGKATKTSFECMECGKKFKKNIGPKTFEVKCPKCGSTDIEVIG